jgi:signal transduction histidine kinase
VRSLLFKVVAALVVALAVSAAVTALIASRLTRDALDGQAERNAMSHLSVLQEAYADRERGLVVDTRNLAETLVSRGLLDASRRPELIAELGRAGNNLEFDILRVLDAAGRDLPTPVGIGATLASPSGAPEERVSLEPASRLLRTREGGWVQAVPVALGSGPDRLLLLAGHKFQDPFAYQLRKQIGSLDHIVLVAGGQMAGSTLPEQPPAPPAQDRETKAVPREPKVVDLDGARSLIAYTPVSRSVDAAAIGVVLTDPTAALDRSLSQTRVVSALLSAMVALGLGWLLFRAIIRPLVDLAATAGQVAGGDARASFRLGPSGPLSGMAAGGDEIATLAGSLEHMRVELQARLDTIAAQAEELRESSRRIVAAQDGERHRLARDLHDGLQQQLVVLRMQVGMLEDGDENVGRLGQQLDSVIEQLREVTHNLYPSILVDRGLTAALHSYVGRLPVSVRLTCAPEEFPRLPVELESGAYFLLGEAVTNALKHSGASTIEIGLKVADGWLHVSVADDGQGFVVGDGRRRGGLLHMEDRVRSFGGTLEITSTPGAGTRVVAGFPLRVEIPAG